MRVIERRSLEVGTVRNRVGSGLRRAGWGAWQFALLVAICAVGCTSETPPTVDRGVPAASPEEPNLDPAATPDEREPATGALAGAPEVPSAAPRPTGDDPSEPDILTAPTGDAAKPDVDPAPSGASTLADFQKLDRSDERVAIPEALRTDPGPAGSHQRIFWIREFCGYLPADEAALFQRYPFRLVVYADDRVEYRTPQFRHFRAVLTTEEKQIFHEALRSGTLATHPNTMIPVGVTDFGTTIIGGVVDGEVRETRYTRDVVSDPRFKGVIEEVLERALAYEPKTK